jgi:hypothetical protein
MHSVGRQSAGVIETHRRSVQLWTTDKRLAAVAADSQLAHAGRSCAGSHGKTASATWVQEEGLRNRDAG